MSIHLTGEEYRELCNNYAGYCKHCDDITTEDGVEPDVEDYECPVCNNYSLMGIEEAFLQGFIFINSMK